MSYNLGYATKENHLQFIGMQPLQKVGAEEPRCVYDASVSFKGALLSNQQVWVTLIFLSKRDKELKNIQLLKAELM